MVLPRDKKGIDEMKNTLFSRKRFLGFGMSVSETFYEENGTLFCDTYRSGYWSGESSTAKATKEQIEKAIKDEQEIHIKALSELQVTLEKIRNM